VRGLKKHERRSARRRTDGGLTKPHVKPHADGEGGRGRSDKRKTGGDLRLARLGLRLTGLLTGRVERARATPLGAGERAGGGGGDDRVRLGLRGGVGRGAGHN